MVERAFARSQHAPGFSAEFVSRQRIVYGRNVETRDWSGSGSYSYLPYGDVVQLAIHSDGIPANSPPEFVQTEVQAFGLTYFVALTPSVRRLLPRRASAVLAAKRWLEFSDDPLELVRSGFSWALEIVAAATIPPRLLARLQQADDVTAVGQQRVDGFLTTAYRTEFRQFAGRCGTSAASKSSACGESEAESAAQQFELWIDRSGVVRQIQRTISETVRSPRVNLTQRVLFLSYHPQPNLIIPTPAETIRLSSVIARTSAAARVRASS
jgi:hypothetical protein